MATHGSQCPLFNHSPIFKNNFFTLPRPKLRDVFFSQRILFTHAIFVSASDHRRTQLATFAHAASGRANVIRHWGALSVPAALAADIEFVSGLGVFVAQPTRKTARAGTGTAAFGGQKMNAIISTQRAFRFFVINHSFFTAPIVFGSRESAIRFLYYFLNEICGMLLNPSYLPPSCVCLHSRLTDRAPPSAPITTVDAALASAGDYPGGTDFSILPETIRALYNVSAAFTAGAATQQVCARGSPLRSHSAINS